jgi:predicted deacetylase
VSGCPRYQPFLLANCRGRLLVSIHDVTPAHASRIGAIHRLLAKHGIENPALFVVPNWHGAWPLARDQTLVDDLRTRQGAGAEVFLHGLRHDEEGTTRTAAQHARAFGRTAREAEFLSLTESEADERIAKGLAMLGDVGLEPVGFVPPAWFHGQGLSEVLVRRNLRFTENSWNVWSVDGGQRHRAPAVHWSARTPFRGAAGVVIERVRRPFDALHGLVRLAIHPLDIEEPRVARSLEHALDYLLERRTPVTYCEVLEPA